MLVDYKNYLNHDYDVGLVLLFNVTRSLQCRNIVDRVYGTLGMLHPRTRERITVDYSQENLEHPAKLFTQVGKLMLEENGPINRFTLFWFMSKPHMLGTPSWLPGYMYPIEGQALCMERAGWPKDPTSPYYEPRISTSLSIPAVSLKHPDNIQIDGMFIDQVADVVHLDWEWSYYGSSDEDVSLAAQNATDFLCIEAQCACLAGGAGLAPSSIVYCQILVANRDIQELEAYNTEEICQDHQEALSYFHARQTGVDEQGLRPNKPRLYRYVSSISEKWKSGRSFFTTKSGRVGIGGFDSTLAAGDHVVVLFGAHQLFLLRDAPADGLQLMIGDAFIPGLMDCEVFNDVDKLHRQTLEIC